MLSGQNYSVTVFNRTFSINSLVVLGLIILLGATLRIYKVDYQSLWQDEIHSFYIAGSDHSFSDVLRESRHDQPPVYFLLLHLWFKIFSYNEFYARLLSAIIGILGIPAVFFLGREVKNDRVGLLVAAITAVNYFHIYHSQEVRFYSLFFLEATLSYLFFLRCIRDPKKLNYAGYILFTTLCLYTHYFALVLSVSQALIFIAYIIIYKPEKKFIISSVVSAVIVLLLISPWIPIFFTDSQISSFWVSAVRFPQFLVAYLYEFTRDKVSFYIFELLIIYFVAITIINWQKEKPPVNVLILFAWIGLGFAIPLIYSWIKFPILITRYVIFILPAIFMIIALSLDKITNKYLRIALPIIIVLSSVRSLFYIQDYYDKLYKQQIKEVVLALKEEKTDVPLKISGHAWHYNFYFDYVDYKGAKVVHHWEPDIPEKIKNSDSFWILQVNLVPETWEKKLTQGQFYLAREIKFHAARASLYKRKPVTAQK